MTMTLRERILAVYRGETPDVVPYMLDLSHWFYHKKPPALGPQHCLREAGVRADRLP